VVSPPDFTTENLSHTSDLGIRPPRLHSPRRTMKIGAQSLSGTLVLM